jgi:hypothetical protein
VPSHERWWEAQRREDLKNILKVSMASSPDVPRDRPDWRAHVRLERHAIGLGFRTDCQVQLKRAKREGEREGETDRESLRKREKAKEKAEE